MHVLLVICGGGLLLGLFVLFGWLWGASVAGVILAARVFVPVWLVIAIINLWVGVTRAGYGVRDELPILLIVFVVPAVIATWVIWRLSHA